MLVLKLGRFFVLLCVVCVCTSEEVQHRTPVDDAIRAGDFLTATSAPWTCHRFYSRPGAVSWLGCDVTGREAALIFLLRETRDTHIARASAHHQRTSPFIHLLAAAFSRGEKKYENLRESTQRAGDAHSLIYIISILLRKMPERK